MTKGGFTYTIPVWCETLVTVERVEPIIDKKGFCSVVKKGGQTLLQNFTAELVEGHIGTSKEEGKYGARSKHPG